jgi:hypothetical protein
MTALSADNPFYVAIIKREAAAINTTVDGCQIDKGEP